MTNLTNEALKHAKNIREHILYAARYGFVDEEEQEKLEAAADYIERQIAAEPVAPPEGHEMLCVCPHMRALQAELDKCRERQIGNCAPELYEAKLTIEGLEARVAELENAITRKALAGQPQ